MMLAAFDSGAVAQWLTIAVVVAGVFYFRRPGGGGLAISELQEANRLLEHRVQEQAKRITELEARTDVTIAVAAAIAPLSRIIERHEENAADRGERLVALLGVVADRLGPEPE